MKSVVYRNIDNVHYALDHGADINCRSSGIVSNTLYTLIASVYSIIKNSSH